jgi:hypothetical protein
VPVVYPHRIRLRGPWECEPLRRDGDGPLPAPSRMTLPCRWADGGLHDFVGWVRFRRRFGYPGTIDPHERVWLTGAGISGRAALRLNGEPLAEGVAGPFAFDVTARLRSRNELAVEIEAGPEGGLTGEVALEVRCTAYLEQVRFESQRDERGLSVTVRGRVAGTADGPLELYVLVDRRTTAYELIASPADFRLIGEPVPLPQGVAKIPVRVDLVRGAEVWYTIEEELAPSAAASGPRLGP